MLTININLSVLFSYRDSVVNNSITHLINKGILCIFLPLETNTENWIWLGCGIKDDYLRERPELLWGVTSVEVFLRDASLYLLELLTKPRKTPKD